MVKSLEEYYKEFIEIRSDEVCNFICRMNLWGVVNGTYFAYQVMISQGFGQIVNVSSLVGLLPGGLTACYTTSKHAVTGFTLSLRAEAYQYGIKELRK